MYAANSECISYRIRSIALFHATADSMNCAHAPCAIAKYWRNLWPWGDGRSFWRGMQRGAAPSNVHLKCLFENFPNLRSLFENPLWLVTSHPEWTNEFDDLADTIRVGGKPLDGYNGKLTRLLYDRVDWPCLAAHFVLLQTRGTRFEFHRMWLKQNFVAMAGLSCIQRPINNIRNELRDYLFPTMFGTESASQVGRRRWISCWDANETLFELLKGRNWLYGDDQHLALLIWNFRQQLQHELDVGPPQAMAPSGCGLPHSLRQKWCRKRSQWMDHPIHLNGICCEFSGQHA